MVLSLKAVSVCVARTADCGGTGESTRACVADGKGLMYAIRLVITAMLNSSATSSRLAFNSRCRSGSCGKNRQIGVDARSVVEREFLGSEMYRPCW